MAQGNNNTKTAKKTKEVSVFSITVFSGRKEISLQLLPYEDLIFSVI